VLERAAQLLLAHGQRGLQRSGGALDRELLAVERVQRLGRAHARRQERRVLLLHQLGEAQVEHVARRRERQLAHQRSSSKASSS
jgi:hypothetical protein